MAINKRFKELLQDESLSQTDLCSEINYSERSLSHFLNGRTKFPRMDFVMKMMKGKPNWNWRWIFFEEGEKIVDDNNISILQDIAKGDDISENAVVKGLTDQLNYLFVENAELRKQISEQRK